MAGSELVVRDKGTHVLSAAEKQFVTMRVCGQLFGIPVLGVEDVLRPRRITKAPLAPAMVEGSINLRGRIVTVINLRQRLGLASSGSYEHDYMLVVVAHQEEHYSLMVDKIGDVLSLPVSDFERNPANLGEAWREVSLGVYRLSSEIMIILDVAKLLSIE